MNSGTRSALDFMARELRDRAFVLRESNPGGAMNQHAAQLEGDAFILEQIAINGRLPDNWGAAVTLTAQINRRPVVPWLPDHPLYVVLAEFDGWPGRGPRFVCDHYGIPRRSMEWGDPIAYETRLDRDATRAVAEARMRHIAGRLGNTAIARLEIVEATIGDGP